MDDIQVTFSTILAFFGALTVIAGGTKVIMQMLSPFKKLSERIDACENRLSQHDVFLDNDQKAIKEIREMAKENLRVNMALLNHFIDGNGVDKMKALREEIQDRMF